MLNRNKFFVLYQSSNSALIIFLLKSRHSTSKYYLRACFRFAAIRVGKYVRQVHTGQHRLQLLLGILHCKREGFEITKKPNIQGRIKLTIVNFLGRSTPSSSAKVYSRSFQGIQMVNIKLDTSVKMKKLY